MNITKMIFLIFVSLVLGCKTTQKNTKSLYNYDGFITYDDPIFDKIKDFERTVVSPFWLKNNIRSVHLIELKPEEGRKSSIKYEFDVGKNIIRLTNYDKDLNEIMDRNYYHYPGYAGDEIMNYGYSKYDANRKKHYISSHNEKEKLIILETFENDNLISLDSNYYTSNFKPVLTKTYNSNNELLTIKKKEYSDNKLSLNLIVRKNGISGGSIRVYNKDNKHIYVSPLTNIDDEIMGYEIDTIKNEITEWEGGNFKYIARKNDILYYNSNTRTLLRTTERYTQTVKFNEQLFPTKSEYNSKSIDGNKTINYKYNEFGDIVSKNYLPKESHDDNEYYEYEYDNNQNWIIRKTYINKVLFRQTDRIIEYF